MKITQFVKCIQNLSKMYTKRGEKCKKLILNDNITEWHLIISLIN